LIGLLNDARLKAKLPAVGFLNPWLYESGNSFLIDIVLGASRGCDGTNHQTGAKVKGGAVIPNAYWNATVGWDPVTGLGIPDFQKMLATSLRQDADDDNDD
jgi:tripeptidyl-peptidase-1